MIFFFKDLLSSGLIPTASLELSFLKKITKQRDNIEFYKSFLNDEKYCDQLHIFDSLKRKYLRNINTNYLQLIPDKIME